MAAWRCATRNQNDSCQTIIRMTTVTTVTAAVDTPAILPLHSPAEFTGPAEATDDISKMEALHRAATRFVDIMRPGARTTLLPFSDEVDKPRPFNADKEALKEEIKELKRDHLGIDEVTDVLSFPIDGREQLPDGVPRQLGDAVLCPQVTGAEWQGPLVHGLLHLLGYDHGDEMEGREEAYEQ